MDSSLLFDSHAHYDDEKFDGLRDGLLSSMREQGVGGIVNAGASLTSSQTSRDLAHTYGFLWFCAGVHPENAAEDMKNADWLSRVEALSRDEKCVAIGEIGLDYYYGKDTADEQKECFDAQLSLAEKRGLPVVIHDREAHGDCLDILKAHPRVTGLFHCFSGSVEMAKELLAKGWYLSMGGVVTFSNARKAVEVVEALPSLHPEGKKRLLLETDCPYLAPVPYRGKLNHSGLMRHTCEKVAALWKMPPDEVAAVTYENALRFYDLPDNR